MCGGLPAPSRAPAAPAPGMGCICVTSPHTPKQWMQAALGAQHRQQGVKSPPLGLFYIVPQHPEPQKPNSPAPCQALPADWLQVSTPLSPPRAPGHYCQLQAEREPAAGPSPQRHASRACPGPPLSPHPAQGAWLQWPLPGSEAPPWPRAHVHGAPGSAGSPVAASASCSLQQTCRWSGTPAATAAAPGPRVVLCPQDAATRGQGSLGGASWD